MINRAQIFDQIFRDDRLAVPDPQAFIRKFAPVADTKAARLPRRGPTGPVPAPNLIGDIPPSGFAITQAGNYTLTKDVTWTPDAEATAAITIAVDGVTLDLGGFSLSVEPGAPDRQLASIFISDCTSVTVSNGILLNACFRGIAAEDVTDLTVQSVTVSGVTFDDIATRNLCPAGVSATACSKVLIEDCRVEYMYVTADLAAGIVGFGCTGLTVANAHVAHLTNYDGSMQGVSCYGSVAVGWKGCSASHLQSFFNGNIRTGGHTVIGFMPCLSVEVAVDNCTADTIVGSRDDCHGLSVFVCYNVEVSDFSADTVVCGPPPYNTGAKATGLEVYGWRVQVTGCCVKNITATNPQDRQAAGFSAWGWGIGFIDCRSETVHVRDQTGNRAPDLGYGVGFGWAPDPRPDLCEGTAQDVGYLQCSATDCDVGFDTWNHVKSNWSGTATTGCTQDYLLPTDPPGTRTLFADPASECNPAITVTLTDQAHGNSLPPA